LSGEEEVEERGGGREKERRPSCKWSGKEDEALRQVRGRGLG
jgi:hypothetical protein